MYSLKRVQSSYNNTSHEIAIELLPNSIPPREESILSLYWRSKTWTTISKKPWLQGLFTPLCHPPSQDPSLSRRKAVGRDQAFCGLLWTQFHHSPVSIPPFTGPNSPWTTLWGPWDLSSAYNFIQIKEGDELKTEFHITSVHYEYEHRTYWEPCGPRTDCSLPSTVAQTLCQRREMPCIDPGQRTAGWCHETIHKLCL